MSKISDMEDRMKKFAILFYPRTTPKTGRGRIPLSLIAIATLLEKAGYSVEIIDANVEDDYEKKVVKNLDRALFVGISSMTGYQIYDGLKISKLIKGEKPFIPIVWGGWHPSLTSSQTIQSPFIDIVVRGQGEKTVLELADSFKNNRPLNGILGITYKDGKRIIENADRPFEDINNFPSYSYHLIDVEKYISDYPDVNSRTISYISSQGCPYRCSFCAESLVNKRRWSGLRPQRVIKDLKFLVDTYKVNGLIFEDSNFFIDKERVKQICQEIIDTKLKIRWGNVNGRQDQLVKYEPDLWQVIKKSGCSSILVGAESGSQEVLDMLSKDSKVEYAIDLAKICSQYDITVVYSLMIGFPREPEKEFCKTLDLIDKILSIDHRHQFKLFFYTPYPGTPLFELSKENGLKVPETLEGWSKFNLYRLNVPWLSKKHAMKIKFIRQYFFLLLHPSPGIRSLITKNFVLRASFRIAYKTAYFRWRHRFFAFPFELILFYGFQWAYRLRRPRY